MRIGFLADLHIANFRAHGGPVVDSINRRCRLCLDTLRAALARAKALSCDRVYVLGDVFDTTRPEPQLVREVQNIIASSGLVVVFMLGNHDMVSHTEHDHSLGPLDPVGRVVSKPTVDWNGAAHDLVLVPFQPGPAQLWLPEVLKVMELPKSPSTLLLHLGISDHDTAGFMKATHDQVPAHALAELARQYNFKAIFAGNWHFHRVFNLGTPQFTKAVQVGTLCPTGWDNPGIEGHGMMPTFDTATNELRVECIPGPRFLNLKQDADFVHQLGAAALAECTVYVRVKADLEHMAPVQAALEALKSMSGLAGYEVEPDDIEARAQARTAATVARSADTLDAALIGYVEQMPLAEGVDRAAVLEKAKSFLK